MKNSLSILLAALVLAFTVPVLAVAQGSEHTYFHPKLRDKEMSVNRLVLLPPAVHVSKNGVKGQEGMGAESEKATAYFALEVAAALTARGASVGTPFTEDALQGNDELRSALADVQRQFDEIAPKIFAKKKDIKQGRFTVGDGVAVLNSKGDLDALVLVRAVGSQETTGKAIMTKGIIGMVATRGKTLYRSRVALVDAKNGDILFLGDYTSWNSPGPELIREIVQEASS